MVTFVLHGGKTRLDCENNHKFHQEMFNFDKKEINFLVVSFAKPADQQELTLEEKEKIIRLNSSKKINFIYASKENLVNQLKQADSVYLRGGNTHLLKNVLCNIEDLKYLFDGKIIAGSSAGFIVLAKYYYDNDYDTIEEGLNILPIKAMSHYGLPNQYGKDNEKELEQLKAYKTEEKLETIALKETEFVIKNINEFHDISLIIFYDKNGKILLQDRRHHSKVGEEWGFFGGHIEKGETKEQALIREVKEELGINLTDHKFIGDADSLVNNLAINRAVYLSPLNDKEKDFYLNEGGAYKIFSIQEARKLKLIPGDEKVLDLIERKINDK